MKNPLTIHLDSSESLHYNYENFPIYTQKDLLSNYDYQALVHWHPDLEFIYIVEGKMDFFVNGKIVSLEKNTALFINSQRLHYGFLKKKKECIFIALVVSPDILPDSCQDYFKKKFGLKNKDYLYLDSNIDVQKTIIDSILQVHLAMDPNCFNPLNVLAKAYDLIYQVGEQLNNYENNLHDSKDQNLFLQMTNYIVQNYSEKITLTTLSKQVGISRNKCCELFKQYTNQSFNEYITHYRITKSVKLLKSTHLPITEIALSCGFSSSSYYSSIFNKLKGMSPKDLRNTFKK